MFEVLIRSHANWEIYKNGILLRHENIDMLNKLYMRLALCFFLLSFLGNKYNVEKLIETVRDLSMFDLLYWYSKLESFSEYGRKELRKLVKAFDLIYLS